MSLSWKVALVTVGAAIALGSIAQMRVATADMPTTAPTTQEDWHVQSPLDFTMDSLDGKQVPLSQYRGKVLMIVNVASKCGFTPQYAQLEAVYQKYGPQGLVILGFPCNQFKQQEPGTAAQIQAFCTQKYGVTFDMFSKIEVNGDNACGLYKYLTSEETDPQFPGPVKWNFEKFLVSREGKVVDRFRSKITPDSEEMTKAIEAELTKGN